MKTTDFFWSWDGQPAIRDTTMNRARASTMLKSWRQKAAAASAGRTERYDLCRVGRGIYRVQTASGLTGTMFVGSCAAQGARHAGR